MVKNNCSRSPLRDITADALRLARRPNGVIKRIHQTQEKVLLFSKSAPALRNGSTLCKVDVKQASACSKRRKGSASSRNGERSPRKKKPKLVPPSGSDINNTTIVINETPGELTAQPMISVPAEDVWLCEPFIAEDLFAYTKSLESRHLLPVDYLSECGSRVSEEMRATLVNWLVEIHGHLKLEPETLHVAVKLLDTTLNRSDIGVTRLQLCGLAVFWIASKLENRPLTAQELLQLMCYTGDASILVKMEEQVLKLLEFQVQVADPIFFLNRLLLYDENGESQELMNTCCYLMDSFLRDVSVVAVAPSELASSALLAARYIDGVVDWPLPLAYATGHWPTPDILRPLAVKMIRTLMEVEDISSTYSGAYRKYSSRKRFHALSKSDKFRPAHLKCTIDALQSSSSFNC